MKLLSILSIVSISAVVSVPFASVSSKLLSKFKLFAQIAATAGCTKILTEISFDCGERCQGDLQGTIVQDAILDETTQGAGYVAFIPSKNTIFASFRGTKTLASAILNLDIFKSAPDFNSNGFRDQGPLIHSGFEKTYIPLKERIQVAVKLLADQNPSAEIVFSGHSLGAAVANLAAFDFSARNNQTYDKRVSLFTYGQPRIGNQQYDEAFQALDFSKRYFRLIQQGDPVTELPPLPLGFVNTGLPFEIDSNNSVKSCLIDGPGDESSGCTTDFKLQNITKHILDFGYFQRGQLGCVEI
jgi:hypothetical protein